jgi:hypothetical protein
MAVAKAGFEAKDERKSSWARIENGKDSSWVLGTNSSKSERVGLAFFRNQVEIFREQVKRKWREGQLQVRKIMEAVRLVEVRKERERSGGSLAGNDTGAGGWVGVGPRLT